MKQFLIAVFAFAIATSANHLSAQNCGGSPGTITVTPINVNTSPSVVTVTWTHTGFTGAFWGGWNYDVSYKRSTDANYTPAGSSGGGSKTITGLIPGIRYDFHISGIRHCELDGSTLIQSLSGNRNAFPLIPVAPVALAATNVGANSFTANWQINSLADQFLVDVSTRSDFASLVRNGVNAGNAASLAIGGLATGIPYYYRVRGSNSSGASLNSNHSAPLSWL